MVFDVGFSCNECGRPLPAYRRLRVQVKNMAEMIKDDELENCAGGDGQDPMMYSVYLYVPPSREIVTRVVVKACCPAEAEKKALARVLSCYKVHSMEPWDGTYNWGGTR